MKNIAKDRALGNRGVALLIALLVMFLPKGIMPSFGTLFDRKVKQEA